MKRLLLISLVALGTFTMSGCQMIENVIDPEKDYTLDSFKTLLAERKLSENVPYQKVTMKNSLTTSSNEKKESEKEYVYDNESKKWEDETDIYLTVLSDLSLIASIKSITSSTSYKFYARKNKYRVNRVVNEPEGKLTCDWQFNEKGFMFQADLEYVNKDAIESTTQKTTFTYTE